MQSKYDSCYPDMLAPATIPVTAGKKTANTEKKDSGFSPSLLR